MRTRLANTLFRMANWLSPKSMPPVLAGGQWSGTQFVDAFKRTRAPTPNELMAELKNTAWACASINAAVCASNPPQLFVATQEGQPSPKCLTHPLTPRQERSLRHDARLPIQHRKAAKLEQVFDHP